jgi:quinol monooxygenase YgiN
VAHSGVVRPVPCRAVPESSRHRRESLRRTVKSRNRWPVRLRAILLPEGEMLMILIAGYTLTEADRRDAAVAAFADMLQRARHRDGCLDFSISADPVDQERINLFECWIDQRSLNAWRKVAKGPKVKLRESHVNLYRSDKAEKPF